MGLNISHQGWHTLEINCHHSTTQDRDLQQKLIATNTESVFILNMLATILGSSHYKVVVISLLFKTETCNKYKTPLVNLYIS